MRNECGFDAPYVIRYNAEKCNLEAIAVKLLSRSVLLVLLVVAMLTNCVLAEEETAVSMADLQAGGTYQATTMFVSDLMPQKLNDEAADWYSVQQGCATDGTYVYYILENQTQKLCALHKVRIADWTTVDIRFELYLGHGNDMTYNPKINKLVVTNNKPTYNVLSIIDPDTLEIVQTRELPINMYAIAYSEERDQYAIGLSNGYSFVITDGEFNELARYEGYDTGKLRQGADCDANYIYFPQSRQAGAAGYNGIAVYDWSGNFITLIDVKKNKLEGESMFHVGDDYYLVCNLGGSYTFKLDVFEK